MQRQKSTKMSRSTLCKYDTGGPLVISENGEQKLFGQASAIPSDCAESTPGNECCQKF